MKILSKIELSPTFCPKAVQKSSKKLNYLIHFQRLCGYLFDISFELFREISNRMEFNLTPRFEPFCTQRKKKCPKRVQIQVKVELLWSQEIDILKKFKILEWSWTPMCTSFQKELKITRSSNQTIQRIPLLSPKENCYKTHFQILFKSPMKKIRFTNFSIKLKNAKRKFFLGKVHWK